MVYIYVLELIKGKYYIGKTNSPKFRIDQHFKSGASTWTTKYYPIRIVEIISNCDDYDEDKYTRKYMDKYGIDNVRGGSFCEEKFDETTIKILEKMSKSTQNKCFNCGLVGHFAKDCKKYKKHENIEETVQESLLEEDQYAKIEKEKNGKCLPLIDAFYNIMKFMNLK